MSNAHIAVHFSAHNPRGLVVIQPRNVDGTFRSPDANFSNRTSTGHMTHNGATVKRFR